MRTTLRASQLFALMLFSHQTFVPLSVPSVYMKAFECLAENAYQEARGEGHKGMQAVTHVVLNRAESSDAHVCDIIYKPYQFSWTIQKRQHGRAAKKNAASGVRLPSRLAVWDIFWDGQGQPRPRRNFDPGIENFHATYVSPKWASKLYRRFQIGNHVFYSKSKLHKTSSDRPPRLPTAAFSSFDLLALKDTF